MHSLYGTAAPQAGVTTRSGDERPWSLTRRTLVYLSLLGLAFLLFTIAMGGFDPDENAYVLGAYLTQKHHIYKDFMSLQPPLYTIFLANIFLVFGNFGYLVVERLTSFVFAGGCLLVFYLICRRVLQSSREMALIFSTFLVFNSIFYQCASEAGRSDFMSLFFCLLAVFLILAPFRGLGPVRLAAAGLCIAIAVGTRQNYVHMPLAALVFLALWPRRMAMSIRFSRQVLPLMGGGAVGLLFISLFVANDVTAFMYGVFEYHQSYEAANRGRVVAGILMQPSVIGLAVLAIYVFFYLVMRGLTRNFCVRVFDSGQWLFWLILVMGIPVAMLPPLNFSEYYLPVVPFFILCVASLYTFPQIIRLEQLKYVFFFVAILTCFPNFVEIAQENALRILDRKYWTPLTVLDRSRRVDAILDAAGVTGKIATLSPALLIESKHGFYLELATGPFFYRVSDAMPLDRVKRLHGTSPTALPELLSADMPAAIFGGSDHPSKLDTAFFEFAEAHGYRRVELGRGVLYVRQGGA
jgi:Dolichyl-phosphate-mannose-protein mannosyltransferase